MPTDYELKQCIATITEVYEWLRAWDGGLFVWADYEKRLWLWNDFNKLAAAQAKDIKDCKPLLLAAKEQVKPGDPAMKPIDQAIAKRQKTANVGCEYQDTLNRWTDPKAVDQSQYSDERKAALKAMPKITAWQKG